MAHVTANDTVHFNVKIFVRDDTACAVNRLLKTETNKHRGRERDGQMRIWGVKTACDTECISTLMISSRRVARQAGGRCRASAASITASRCLPTN